MKQPSDLVLIGATVIDGTGGPPLEQAAVRISDGRIAAVGDATRVLADARRDGVDDVIDLDGAFVTPGLINMHTHLSLSLPGAPGPRSTACRPTSSRCTWPTAPAARSSPG